ncbi:MAG: GNAT family N-acetyltransferase, partial [Oscillospiraceae bacterium]|nr:GNAT family N-acetyltransferase [Oscillospiraceae bacterium]
MTIETDRLLLRPFKTEDAADVYEYLKEPSVNCFACMKLHSMSEAAAEMKSRMGDEDFYFAITLKETGKVIGELFGHSE